LGDGLDEQLRTGLIKLAKNTLKSEMEYNLRDITPSYDTDTMTPTWRIDDLLSGLYLSMFYMRPNTALYRLCQNPKCNLYFLVSTTAHKKKYCCKSCSNAMQQRSHRLRKREQREDV
jgi:predicted RNA-binding Zn ribbon-like protein